VDLAEGKVREARLDDHPQKFPQIDDRLLGRPHRYGYAMHTSSTGGNTGDSVLKHDLARSQTHHSTAGHPPHPDRTKVNGFTLWSYYRHIVLLSGLV
jgi:carotenoid cleavage oxygenase